MYNTNFLDARESTSLFQHMLICSAMLDARCAVLCHLHLFKRFLHREEIGRELILISVRLLTYLNESFIQHKPCVRVNDCQIQSHVA